MDTWTKVDKGQRVTEWRGNTIIWPGFDGKVSYNLFVSSPRISILCYCIWFMVCMVSYIIVYGIFIVCSYIIFLPFLRGVLNWGFGQMHPLSCSHIGNPSAVEENRIDKDTINIDQYKGFWDQRCSWTKLFFDLAKVVDVNIATSNKTNFLLGKNSFARVKLTSFQAGNRHLFMTKHVRSICSLLP